MNETQIILKRDAEYWVRYISLTVLLTGAFLCFKIGMELSLQQRCHLCPLPGAQAPLDRTAHLCHLPPLAIYLCKLPCAATQAHRCLVSGLPWQRLRSEGRGVSGKK